MSAFAGLILACESAGGTVDQETVPHAARSATLELLVLLDQIWALLDAPFLFQVEQLAALVPVDRHLLQHLAERRVEIGEAHADGPKLRILGRKRHFIVGPFGVAA